MSAGLSLADIEAKLQYKVDEANESAVDLAAQEHQRVHERILSLAALELTEKGYRDTHVTSIVHKLGITTAVFYSHFSSKRALLAECVRALIDSSLDYVDSREATTSDPAERLLWLCFGHSHVFRLGSTANEESVDLVVQEHERMHNQILALAAHEFATKGYKNTHVTTIIRRLGITATVFYAHFPSKRRLLAECVTDLMSWSIRYVDDVQAEMDDPAERLLWNIYGHSRVFELGSAALRSLTRVEEFEDDGETHKSIQDGFRRHREAYREGCGGRSQREARLTECAGRTRCP